MGKVLWRLNHEENRIGVPIRRNSDGVKYTTIRPTVAFSSSVLGL